MRRRSVAFAFAVVATVVVTAMVRAGGGGHDDHLAPGVSPTNAVGQGIEAGDFEEFAAALRRGNTYANVHSSKWPGGEIRAQISPRNRNTNRAGLF